MKALKAGLYARVSTSEQQTLPLQMEAMRDYATRRGWEIAYSVEEIGSGAKVRPKHQELMALAKKGKIDVIVVWKLDRWGRSLRDLVMSLDDLKCSGVAFVSGWLATRLKSADQGTG